MSHLAVAIQLNRIFTQTIRELNTRSGFINDEVLQCKLITGIGTEHSDTVTIQSVTVCLSKTITLRGVTVSGIISVALNWMNAILGFEYAAPEIKKKTPRSVRRLQA